MIKELWLGNEEIVVQANAVTSRGQLRLDSRRSTSLENNVRTRNARLGKSGGVAEKSMLGFEMEDSLGVV